MEIFTRLKPRCLRARPVPVKEFENLSGIGEERVRALVQVTKLREKALEGMHKILKSYHTQVRKEA